MNPKASSFSFNPTASTWKPTFAAAPPAPAPVPAPVTEEITQAVEQVTIEEKPKAARSPSPVRSSSPARAPSPSPPADEVDEAAEELKEEEIREEDPRQHVNLVFIGHVDAGKSTLSGNILYLLDMVDKRTIDRYEREAKEV